MTDLFTTAPVPAYGSLSHNDERALYDTNPHGWYRYVAKDVAAKLRVAGGAAIATAWPLMSLDYQRAVLEHIPREEWFALLLASWPHIARIAQIGMWPSLSEPERDQIRAARTQEKAA